MLTIQFVLIYHRSNTRPWCHYLKAVKVIYYFNGDKFVRAPHKDALSDLFLTAEGLEGIMLKLEW